MLTLSLIENKHFCTFLYSFDPRYQLPCINTIKNEIADGYYHTTQTIKQILLTYTSSISLTFDLWTSRAHDSYLGLTCHWISDEFLIYDLTLDIIELGAYKTANNIVESIEPMLKEFGIEKNKLLSITTDNSANVKAAITKLSTSLQVSKPIANIFCATHTLQLSINMGLEVADDLINKCKMLISFMSGEKKKKQLRELTNDLENSTNTDYRRDGTNFHEKLLSNDEFKSIKALINLLCLFHKATKILSGSTYTTLSIMVPTVKELVQHLNNTISELDIINEVKDVILSNLSCR
ncbi:21895_t:CDS:2 [Gigaspora margarita]|uniref:21895_t:CDS:1 n=1 Tax=Gigaspora margarita TaxID=4874 RepID=A0ABN7V7P3_GIGMA|nr:21895_t:CDS:2 [Gigaspora margarita]